MRLVWFLAAASASAFVAAATVVYMSHRHHDWVYGSWNEPDDGIQPVDVSPWERECE
jgi:hypothetical protein